MTFNEFIFSNHRLHRIARHLLMWTAFSLYFFIVNISPDKAQDLVKAETYWNAFMLMIYIPISVLSVYVSINFLLPSYLLKNRFFSFVVWMIVLSALNFFIAYQLTRLLAVLTQNLPFDQLPLTFTLFLPVRYGLGLSIAASGFAIVIKLLMTWHLKQKENERLQQQKISSELQLIKTNFHPHFLSDALQNIARLIRSHSVKAPDVILKLSDLLSFILYENNKDSVPLEQELQMVREYLGLEKVFYSNLLVVRLAKKGNGSGMYIAPLTLLSLIQNCCEQCLISIQERLVIDIDLEAREDARQLSFKLCCNGYYESINGIPRPNTGLAQALRRIEVIYQGRHQLETHINKNVFSIWLVLDLEDGEPIMVKAKDQKTVL